MKRQVQTFRNLITRYLGVGLLLIGIGITNSNAQSIANYAFTSTTTGSLDSMIGATSMAGSGAILAGYNDDNASGVLPLGFSFPFMGVRYTHFSANSNGQMELNLSASSTAIGANVTRALGRAYLAPMTGDNSVISAMRYTLTGVAPNRIFRLSFPGFAIPFSPTNQNAEMQVWLYENGVIQYVYGPMFAAVSQTRSISIASSNTATTVQSVTVGTTPTTTASATLTANTFPGGNIIGLHSATQGNRRVYTFTPPNPIGSPASLTFASVNQSSMTLNWIDNCSNESFYLVERSTNGGVNYTTLASLAANTITYNATGLLPGQTYTFRVTAGTEANIDSNVVASQATLPPAAIVSTGVGGNWTNPLTWVGGIVPTASDSVIISDGATVEIDATTAACYALVVGQGTSGIVQFRATPAATLNVSQSVYINTGGNFNAGIGTLTTHTLTVGVSATTPSPGSIVNNGTLDFFGTAGANITFFGNMNGSVTGAGVYDFRRITLNKGNVSLNRPVLTIDAAFTTEGGSTVGMIQTHTAGVLQIAGSFTQTCVLYNAVTGTIPLLGGIWLNNPNFTVTAQNGDMTNNGLLRVSQGTYNISTLAAAVLNFGAGSQLWVEGGVLNHAARILTGSVITFTQSGGVINVATVGNSTSESASFGLTSAATTINWTGGRVVLNQRSTGATIVDYNVAPTVGTFNGTLQIGSTSTATNFDFRINGNTPNIIIDSITNNKSALLRLQTSVRGKIYVPVGCRLNLNGQNLLLFGDSVINNGFIDGRLALSNFVFFRTTSGHYYGGSGIDTVQTYANQNTVGGVTFDKPVVSYRANFSSTTQFLNSANITLGNGLAQAVIVQVGVAGFVGTAGIFDVAPTLNLGTGTYSVSYAQEGAMRTTGLEIPASRSIFNLTVSDTFNVTLAGGPLDITGTLTMTAGKLNTSDANMLTILNTAAAAANVGSATSFVNGPMQRRLPPNLTTASSYAFPIGIGSTYAMMRLINPKTNVTDTIVVQARYIDSATAGTADLVTINTLPNNYYWAVTVPTGGANLDSVSRIEFTRSGLIGINRIAYSSTLSGTYVSKSAGPGVGIITSDILLTSAALAGFFTVGEIIIPISGNFLIGATKTAPDYTTITAFLNDLAGKQVQSNITLRLDSDYDPSLETFPITFNAFAANNTAHTITVKPNTAVTTTIQGSNANAILLFNNNARNFVIDGSNNGSSSRDLTIINNSAATAAVVRYIGTTANQGVQNTTLKNTIIKGGLNTASIGVLVGGTTLSAFSNGLGYSNLLIENNQIYNTNYGVALSGTANLTRIKGITIRNNYFGISVDSVLVRNRQAAIFTQHVDSSLIERNTIFNQFGDINFGTITGIQLSTNSSNITISKNVIRKIRNVNISASGAIGILVATGITGVNNVIVNNEIYDVLSTNDNWGNPYSQFTPHGIYIQNGNGLKVYFNSINLYGVTTIGSAAGTSSGLTIASNTIPGLDIRNNNIRNTITGFTGSKHYALTHYRSTGAIFNYNNYSVAGSQGILAYDFNPVTFTGTDQPLLADLQTTSAANANSVTINPQFVNDSNLIIGLGTITGLGNTISGFTTDRIDSVRNSPPTIGAIEVGVDISGPAISYTNLSNTFLLTNRVITGFATMTDFNGIDTAANKPRIYYKKSSDLDVMGTYPADNNNSFNGWKYAEATNVVSPFNFTIDYSLLFGGAGVIVTDTIQYFVTAQDRQTPTSYVSANPTAGFVATSVDSITTAPTKPNRYVIVDPPLAGTYLVGSAQVSPNFTTLTSAVANLNSRGVSAAVEFQLTDASYRTGTEVYPLVINQVTGGSAVNRVTIRPTLTNTVISGNEAAIFLLNGADYITIDGSITPGGSSLDLSIVDSNTSSNTINIASGGIGLGCISDSIINCKLFGPSSGTSSAVLHIGGSGYDAAGADNRDIVIRNNEIGSGYKGITAFGTSGNKTKGLVIENNIIGNSVAASRITWRGIDMQQLDTVLVNKNTVQYIISSNRNIKAINIGAGVVNAVVSRNIIDTCTYTGTAGYGAIGIHAETGLASNTTISNNMISKLTGDGWSPIFSNDVIVGIRLNTGSDYKVYFNTVNISGTYAGRTGDSRCAAMHVASSVTGVDVRNNIFVNSFVNTNGAPGVGYAFASDAPPAAFTNINYNNYFVAGSQAVLGWAGSNQIDLATFTTSLGGNVNSKTDSIFFVSNGDLHLTGSSIGNLNLQCVAIAGITTDIDNETRFSIPYMGADENVGSPLPVTLSTFTATTKAADALLTWTTVSETNNKGFEVERSLNGSTFEKVGFVKGAGKSNRTSNYGLTDVKAFDVTQSNVLYYRLKQLDFDGEYSYSQVVRVTKNAEAANALSVYPNPYSSAYGVSFNAAKDGVATIEMLDIQGKVVATLDAIITTGNNLVPITEANNLNKGIYFVRLTVNGETQVTKLVKN